MTESPLEAEYQAILERDWANILASDAGRRVIWDILNHTRPFHQSYTGNADTNFNEGRRSVGLWLMAEKLAPNGAHILGEMMVAHSDMMDRLQADAEAREQE